MREPVADNAAARGLNGEGQPDAESRAVAGHEGFQTLIAESRRRSAAGDRGRDAEDIFRELGIAEDAEGAHGSTEEPAAVIAAARGDKKAGVGGASAAVGVTAAPNPNDVLEGDFWPEPVRVLTVRPVGSRTRLEVVGVKTQQFYSRILGTDDLARVRVGTEMGRDFGGRGRRSSWRWRRTASATRTNSTRCSR
jgi:hypothetical protein